MPELGQRGRAQDLPALGLETRWRRPAWVQIPPPAPKFDYLKLSFGEIERVFTEAKRDPVKKVKIILNKLLLGVYEVSM